MNITITFDDQTIKRVSSWEAVFAEKELSKIQGVDCSQNDLTFLPEEIGQLTALQHFYCGCNQLTSLPAAIGQLTALQTFHCEYNRLTTLPEEIGQLTAIRFLDCSENKLTVLPTAIDQLTTLQAFFCAANQLTVLPAEIGLLPALQHFYCGCNQLTSLPQEIGHLTALQTFHCEYNRLTTLPEEIGQLTALQTMNCSNNQLLELPLAILTCRRLKRLYTLDNPITIHPLIQRFIHQQSNVNHHGVFADSQNIHTSSIQTCVKDSIYNILKDKLQITKEQMVQELTEAPALTCQADLLEYMADPTVHSVIGINFEDLFLYVWNRVRENKDIHERINQEMKDAECKCFTGRMTRLVNALIGFYDDVKLEISAAEQISSIILHLKSQAPKGLPLEELKAVCRKALTAQGYAEDVMTPWIEAL